MRIGSTVKFAALSLGLWSTAGVQVPETTGWHCPNMKPVEACSKVHGRLSSQNGIALKIWLIGTTRVVGLDNDSDQLPTLVRKYLELTSPDHSYIYGDFDICPLEPDRPGHMKRACVVGAEKLVVQDVQALRPPFRILATWPTDGKGNAESGQK